MKKTQYSWNLLYGLLTAFVFIATSCNSERFSNIKVQDSSINIIRFEQELFELDIYAFEKTATQLCSTYKQFMPVFGNKIIEIGDPSQAWFNSGLQAFITDQAIFNINNKVSEVLADISISEQELTAAFGRWLSVFPDKEIPDIYTYISGFNQSIVTAENILGISLEKYLGADEALYDQVYPPIPKYQRYVMNPENISSDIIRAWATTEIFYSPEQDNLLSQMIYNGQIMYLTNKLLPETHDTLLWGFTPQQLEFCRNNEKQMWTYLIEQKLLFNTDKFKTSQFINEGPFTKDFTNESPGRAAVWIGYRIVKQYAQNNKNLKLSEIVTSNNYQNILSQSKYRP